MFASTIDDEQPHYFLKTIRLNPGISNLNYIASQLHFMIMVFGFGCADALQPLILVHRDYYAVPKDNSGTVMSNMLFVQLGTKILVSILYGYLIDKFGRKLMIYYGAINLVAGFMLAPVFTSVFPGLVFAKVLISNGGSALSIIPLTADYIHSESRGKAAGINIALTAVGAFLSNIFLKVLFIKEYSLEECYFISGILVFVLFLLNTFALKGGHYYRSQGQAIKGALRSGSGFFTEFKEAVGAFFQNAWLTIALVLRIVGNADFFIAFTILSLFVKSLFPPGISENEENITLNHIQSFVFLPALVCDFVYGHYIDKTNKIIGMSLISLAMGAVAFFLTSLATTPYDFELYLSSILIGMSVPGVYVVSTYLSIKHFPEEKRGVMMGVLNLMGYLGYVIIASGGGYLFDHWKKNAPFILYAALLTIAFVFVVWIYVKRIKDREV